MWPGTLGLNKKAEQSSRDVWMQLGAEGRAETGPGGPGSRRLLLTNGPVGAVFVPWAHPSLGRTEANSQPPALRQGRCGLAGRHSASIALHPLWSELTRWVLGPNCVSECHSCKLGAVLAWPPLYQVYTVQVGG